MKMDTNNGKMNLGFMLFYWMFLPEFGLKGCELLLFAIIWHFSIRKASTWYESGETISNRLGYSREHVTKSLSSLRNKHLIKRSKGKHPHSPTYDYIIDLDKVRTIYPDIDSLIEPATVRNNHNVTGDNITSGGNKTSHNNITDTGVIEQRGDVGPNKSNSPPLITPTLEEVKEYANVTNSHTDFEDFFKVCTEKNWIISGSPVKNWKALFDRWEHKQHREPGQCNYLEKERKNKTVKDGKLNKTLAVGNSSEFEAPDKL